MMQALGSGVSWSDDHPKLGWKPPPIEYMIGQQSANENPIASECGCKPTALKLITERAATAPHGLVYIPDVVRSLVEAGVGLEDAKKQVLGAASDGSIELQPGTRMKAADKKFAPELYGKTYAEYAKVLVKTPVSALKKNPIAQDGRLYLPWKRNGNELSVSDEGQSYKIVKSATGYSLFIAPPGKAPLEMDTFKTEKEAILIAEDYARMFRNAIDYLKNQIPQALRENPIAAAPTSEEWEVVVTGVPEAHRGAIMNLVGPGEAESVGRSKVVLRGFYDDREAANVARAVTRQYGVSAVYGPARAMKLNAAEAKECGCSKQNPVVEGAPVTLETRSNPIAQDDENGVVCRPFTRISRDTTRFNACMVRSKQIGPIETSKNLYDLVAPDIEQNDEEHFYIVCIDYRGQIRDFAELAIGQRHKVSIDIEDILKPVILSTCDAYAVLHSHPSGHAGPSEADKKLTRMIADASAIACPGVVFMDHIVVGSAGRYYSFADKKLYGSR